jgi:hypothetical protein
MGGVSNKTTSHITQVLDLTSFSKSQRSKFKTSPPGGTFRCCLTQRAIIWCDDVSRQPLCVCQILARSDSKFGRQEGISQKRTSAISEVTMRVGIFTVSVFSGDTSHIVHMYHLTYFSRSQRSKMRKFNFDLEK